MHCLAFGVILILFHVGMNHTEQKRKKKGAGGWNSKEGPRDP